MVRVFTPSADSFTNNQLDVENESAVRSAAFTPNRSSPTSNVVKKKKFNHAEFIGSRRPNYLDIIEVTRYNLLYIAQFWYIKEQFRSDPFSVIHFWTSDTYSFPKLSPHLLSYHVPVKEFFSVMRRIIVKAENTVSPKDLQNTVIVLSLPS